ncbi:MAG: sigma-70 family RNA polymerase sigma factor [candidate division Zixibacteria bacterium]|nr:sigma-70 family RNA polymerase sigma factor [candidate division Zixibacteria bacterium]
MVSRQEERELINAALKGDQNAYRELFEAHRKAIFHIVTKIIHNNEEARDLVQETFIKAFGSLASYRFEYRFSTWLYKIAANNSIDYLRKKKINSLSLDKPIKTRDGELEMELPDNSYNPESDYKSKIKRNTIQDAIDELPIKYREVIVLRHHEDRSYEEIAERLHIPVGTVKARIFRARELLKKKLKDLR